MRVVACSVAVCLLRVSHLAVSVEVSRGDLQGDPVFGELVQLLGDEARLLNQQVGSDDLLPETPQAPGQDRLSGGRGIREGTHDGLLQKLFGMSLLDLCLLKPSLALSLCLHWSSEWFTVLYFAAVAPECLDWNQ